MLKSQRLLPNKYWEILLHHIWRCVLLLLFFIFLLRVLNPWVQKWFQSTWYPDEASAEPFRIWSSPLRLFSDLRFGGSSILDHSGFFICAFRLRMANYNSSYNNQERSQISKFMLFVERPCLGEDISSTFTTYLMFKAI